MGAAFLITLRDGVEAALVVAIVMAYLRNLGRTDKFSWVLGGALGGAAVAIAIGAGIYVAVGELEGRAEQLVESLTALAAVGVLTWMIFWMRAQARTIGGALRGRVDLALASGAMLGLASITFIGILREGIEMSLFLLVVVFDASTTDTAIGAFTGLAAAAVIGYVFYRGGQFINLRLFFQVTGGLIILFAAGLLGKAVLELQTLGAFDSYYWPVWDLTSNPVLGHGQFAAFMRGLFGWSAEPSIEQLVAWVAYVSIAGWFFYFGEVPPSVSTRISRWTAILSRALPNGDALATKAEVTSPPDP
ncbi:MAG: FTR1 family protein [Dehalococcoidia bacterium]